MTDTAVDEIRRHIAYSIDMDPTGHEERIQTAPDRNAATFAIAQELINAYTHEIAQNLRTDTRNGYRPNTTRYQHYMEAADHIDPEKP